MSCSPCSALAVTDTFQCDLNILLSLSPVLRSWSLRDVCLTQPTPKVEEEHIQKILDNLFPCAIISPLDCFWEGSKLLSVKNTDPPEMVRDFLPEFKWTTLNPSTILKTIGEILLTNQQHHSSTSDHTAASQHTSSNRYDLQSLEKVMKKVCTCGSRALCKRCVTCCSLPLVVAL